MNQTEKKIKSKKKKDTEEEEIEIKPKKKSLLPPEIKKDEYLVANWNIIDKKYHQKIIHVLYLRNLPQPEQKSPEWFRIRKDMISASNGASALDGNNKYPCQKRYQFILKKCGIKDVFESNENTYHGTKFESIARMLYEHKNNVQIIEYGLLHHPSIDFLGASPDGICGYQTLDKKFCKLVGRLLEIKCPKRRHIKTEGDICPEYYRIQVLLQLECCEFDECDFLQCNITEYSNRQMYLEDQDPEDHCLSKKSHLEKGCLIQLLPANVKIENDPKKIFEFAQWIYPPKIHMTTEEYDQWLVNELSNINNHIKFDSKLHLNHYVFDQVIYWKFNQVSCVLIKRDQEWFKKKLPEFKKTWDYIKFFRQNPKMLSLLEKFVNMSSSKVLEDNNKVMEVIDKLYHEKENKEYIKKLSAMPLHVVTNPAEEDQQMGHVNSDSSQHSKKKKSKDKFENANNMFVDHD